jgi:hypothetical protein
MSVQGIQSVAFRLPADQFAGILAVERCGTARVQWHISCEFFGCGGQALPSLARQLTRPPTVICKVARGRTCDSCPRRIGKTAQIICLMEDVLKIFLGPCLYGMAFRRIIVRPSSKPTVLHPLPFCLSLSKLFQIEHVYIRYYPVAYRISHIIESGGWGTWIETTYYVFTFAIAQCRVRGYSRCIF